MDSDARPGSKPPEFERGTVTEPEFLAAAASYLGIGYIEASPGRFISNDGLRQVRLGAHETSGPELHGHFEAYNYPHNEGGFVVETATVSIIPD